MPTIKRALSRDEGLMAAQRDEPGAKTERAMWDKVVCATAAAGVLRLGTWIGLVVCYAVLTALKRRTIGLSTRRRLT